MTEGERLARQQIEDYPRVRAIVEMVARHLVTRAQCEALNDRGLFHRLATEALGTYLHPIDTTEMQDFPRKRMTCQSCGHQWLLGGALED